MPESPIPQGAMEAANAIAMSPIDIGGLISPFASDRQTAVAELARIIAAHTADPAELGLLRKIADEAKRVWDNGWLRREAATLKNLLTDRIGPRIIITSAADPAELERVKGQRDELLETLRLFEWYDDEGGDKRCPCCSGVQGHDEHAENCNIRIAIEAAEATT